MLWIEVLVGTLIFIVAWAIGAAVKADQLKNACNHEWKVLAADFSDGFISPTETYGLTGTRGKPSSYSREKRHGITKFYTYSAEVGPTGARKTRVYALQCKHCKEVKACDAFTAQAWESEQSSTLQAIAEFDAAMQELNEVVVGQKT